MNFNKACEMEDYQDPELAAIIREVVGYKLTHLPESFPQGCEYNKDWEVSMAVRALRRFGALRPDSLLLGVAAGLEDTLFFLTRHANLVFATDRYLAAAEWSPLAPFSMLLQPTAPTPIEYDPQRLVVEHMDGRWLRFPDNTFDGIFSSGSIEHFGGLADVAASAYEMGRVLKPGGVLSVSTVVRCGGPGVGAGFPGTLTMTWDELRRNIVDASGLELVDEVDTSISEATMATERDLVTVLTDKKVRLEAGGEWEGKPDYAVWDFPHVILQHEGFAFDSVHFALTKTAEYPVVDNSWAKPSNTIIESIQIFARDLIEKNSPPRSEEAPAPAAQPSDGPGDVVAQIAATLSRLDRGGAGTEVPEGWRSVPVNISPELSYAITIDPEMKDPITHAYFWNQGHHVDADMLGVMLGHVAAGDAVIDLGAFIGTFSVAAAAAGCRVLSLDANPHNVALLRASALNNGFDEMRVVHAAVGDAPGAIEFVSNGPWGHVATEQHQGETVSVPQVRVDDLLGRMGWDRVAFVKMDVEGSEIRALAGMRRLLEGPHPPVIIFESNGHTLRFFGATPSGLLATLEQFGYRSYLMDGGRLIETRSGELQPTTVVNYIATKGGPPAIEGWVVAPPMTLEERIARLVTEGHFEYEDHRANTGWTLKLAGPEILGDPRIVDVLQGLAGDSSEAVRRSVQWWTAGKEGDR